MPTDGGGGARSAVTVDKYRETSSRHSEGPTLYSSSSPGKIITRVGRRCRYRRPSFIVFVVVRDTYSIRRTAARILRTVACVDADVTTTTTSSTPPSPHRHHRRRHHRLLPHDGSPPRPPTNTGRIRFTYSPTAYVVRPAARGLRATSTGPFHVVSARANSRRWFILLSRSPICKPQRLPITSLATQLTDSNHGIGY